MRIQQYIARCGVCSRRAAEELISAGRVFVDGRLALLGESIPEGDFSLQVDGKEISLPDSHTYIMLNKPVGYVTTAKDEQGRPTVLNLVEEASTRLFPVGRLDIMSEGLLLLTDDGELCNALTHPSYQVSKTYRVQVRGNITQALLLLKKPVTYENVTYSVPKVSIVKQEPNYAVLDLTISEGKNHEIRNICAGCNLKVLRLTRISQGGISLGNLPSGHWRRLTENELKILKENLHF